MHGITHKIFKKRQFHERARTKTGWKGVMGWRNLAQGRKQFSQQPRPEYIATKGQYPAGVDMKVAPHQNLLSLLIGDMTRVSNSPHETIITRKGRNKSDP